MAGGVAAAGAILTGIFLPAQPAGAGEAAEAAEAADETAGTETETPELAPKGSLA